MNKPTEQDIDAVADKLSWQPDDYVAYCPGPKPGQLPTTTLFGDHEECKAYSGSTPVHQLLQGLRAYSIKEGEGAVRKFLESLHRSTIHNLIDSNLLVVTAPFESRDGERFEPRDSK